MCGIVGYVGQNNAVDVLIMGLKRLEYRGYDSVGISVLQNNTFQTVKTKGKVSAIEAMIDGIHPSTQGIGHTRWATHGEPTDLNSHPHISDNVVLVHNGIIENYLELKNQLIEEGYQFRSETDTEVIAHYADKMVKRHHDPLVAIKHTMEALHGQYAVVMMIDGNKDTLYAFRSGSPLVIGVDEKQHFIASDVSAFQAYTKNFIDIDEKEICIVKEDEIKVYNFDLELQTKTVQVADWLENFEGKGDYDHYMLKEMHEQKDIVANLISLHTSGNTLDFSIDGLKSEWFENLRQIHIIACGTAYNAGLLGKTWIESENDISVNVHVASEFRYGDVRLHKDSLAIFISQSGETADTLASLRHTKEQGIKTLALVNNPGSSLAKEADYLIHTRAGMEQSVASTKAYSAQSTLLYLFAMMLKQQQNSDIVDLTDLRKIPQLIEDCFKAQDHIKEIAKDLIETQSAFYLGRGLDSLTSIEGSLKLKEISYIHSEAIQAGELKHGSIALIDENVVSVATLTQDKLVEKTLSNIQEVRARNGEVILITKERYTIDPSIYTHRIDIPESSDVLAPLLSIIMHQILAYETSVARGCDVDQPRNLAKSVTVE